MRRLWIACAFALAATSAFAQDPNTTLRVRAKGTGVPLSKVDVTVAGAKITSDPKGEVKVFVPAAGKGAVTFSRNGFVTLEVPFDDLRPPGEFDVFLYPTVGDDDVIIITGRKKPQVSRKTVSIEESRKIAPGGDPAQVVKLLPGVQQRGGGDGGFGNQFVVRGSGPRDSRYYIDGLEVPFIFHGIGNLSVIPAPLMSEVEFDAGGFGPEYGNATGGVITIRTVSEIPERPYTEFIVNIPFYSGLFHTRPLSEKESLTVGVRRSYIDAVIKAVLKRRNQEDGAEMTFVPYFADGQIVYLKKDDSGHTKITLLTATDGLKAAVPSDSFADEDGRISLAFSTAFANLGVERAGRIDREWRYVTTPQVFYIKSAADFVGNEFGSKLYVMRAPTEVTQRLSKDEELVFGVDPAYGAAKIDVSAIDFRPGDPTFDPEDAPKRTIESTVRFSTFSAWTGIDHRLVDVILTPGVRAHYNGQIKQTSVDPRLRGRYLLDDEHTLKAAVGQYSQSPDPGQASEEFGNSELTFTRSIHYVLGLETKWGDAWTTDVQTFYKTAKGAVTGHPEDRYDNEGSFRSRGAEVFIRRNLTGRLFGWLSYTYSKTEERDSDAEPFRDSRYDQTNVVNLVGSYKLTALWEIGSRYNHHTGDTRTPVADAVYNVNLDKYQARRVDGDEASERLPSYNALTLYGTKQFLFDTWKMALKFGMESYWPKPQIAGVGYNYDYSEEEESKGLTAIPFLELRGEL